MASRSSKKRARATRVSGEWDKYKHLRAILSRRAGKDELGRYRGLHALPIFLRHGVPLGVRT